MFDWVLNAVLMWNLKVQGFFCFHETHHMIILPRKYCISWRKNYAEITFFHAQS